MRLFVALDIDDSIRDRITRFLEGIQPFAPEARWVKPESLHVTLKFIGEQKDEAFAHIKEKLQTIVAPTTDIHFRSYGFFPNPKSARVFWVGMQVGLELTALAREIDEQMSQLGIEKENRPFSPHLTLARSPGGSGAPHRRKEDRPNQVFALLQKRLSTLPEPDFGQMTAKEFFLYQSQLSPKGSKYTKQARFALK